MPSLRVDRIDDLNLVVCSRKPLNGQHHLPRSTDSENNAWQEHGTENKSFLSVVIPAKNEAASLPRLIDEITSVLRPLTRTRQSTLTGFEIVLVDDASTDLTQFVIDDLVVEYPELMVLRLVMSGGQSAATMTGIRAARGNWIATLDADLQNDPMDLRRLWRALPGYDGVLGWRVKRQDTWFKRVISYWANLVRNHVLGQFIRDTGCSVRIFPRDVALRLPTFNGMHRFFGPLLLREGCKLLQVPVRHRPRPHGRSHYSFSNRLFHVVIDLLGVLWLIRRPLDCRVTVASDLGEPMLQRESHVTTLSSR
jgi:dolichol-phosphate mannosyltransferase